jgi:hypothetical protein
MSFRPLYIAAALSLSLWTGPSFAQMAGIQGVITDPAQASVPGVAVRVTNIATGVQTTARTNEQGFYTLPFLQPGTYRIEAEQAGFSPVTRDNLVLNVDQVARVDFSLRVGTVAETIEVTAAAALLESETTVMGQVIDNKRIVEMPLNLRNYLQLAQFSAGCCRPAPSAGARGPPVRMAPRAVSSPWANAATRPTCCSTASTIARAPLEDPWASSRKPSSRRWTLSASSRW